MGASRGLCFCLLGLGAHLARALSQDAAAAPDASALVQREVQLLHSEAELGPRNSLGPRYRLGPRYHRAHLSPQLARTLLNTALSQVHMQMISHEDTLEEELDLGLRLRKYLSKLTSTLGRRGTLFAEVAGIFPTGQMDEADRGAAMLLLGLLRNKTFASALAGGLKAISGTVNAYRWRTEKRVASLVVASANATDQKLPQLVKDFFGNQHSMLRGFVKDVEKGLRSTLAALPSEYGPLTKIGGNMVSQLISHAQGVLANNTEAIVESQGGKFCDGLDVMMADELLPLANQSVAALSSVDAFAREALPEVANETAKIGKVVSSLSTGLTLLHDESTSWIERICGLVGSMATQ
mmetsp:Transcript_50374/g.146156  ORF Transcript_50374/g.146156 Transcript_50374/m.146156 type:complete len:352 (-) Transcript_50374:144-1199(-)